MVILCTFKVVHQYPLTHPNKRKYTVALNSKLTTKTTAIYSKLQIIYFIYLIMYNQCSFSLHWPFLVNIKCRMFEVNKMRAPKNIDLPPT